MKALRRGRAKSNASETSITIPDQGGGSFENSRKPGVGGSGANLTTINVTSGEEAKREEGRGDGTSDQPWKSIVRKTAVVRTATRRYSQTKIILLETIPD